MIALIEEKTPFFPMTLLATFVTLTNDIFGPWFVQREDFFSVGAFDITNFQVVAALVHVLTVDIEIGIVVQWLEVGTCLTVAKSRLVPSVLVIAPVVLALHSLDGTFE